MKQLPRTSILVLAGAAAAALSGCARHSNTAAPIQVGTLPTFDARQEIDAGNANHSDFDLADLDGDGKLDLAVLSIDGDLKILANNGSAFLPVRSIQLGGSPLCLAGGDFDADGDRDYAVVRQDAERIDLLRNDGNGAFASAGELPCGPGGLYAVCADLDGDGARDLVMTRSGSPALAWWKGDATGAFVEQPSIVLPGGGFALHVSVGDVTRDGLDDLVVCDPTLERVVVLHGGVGSAPGVAGTDVLDVPGAPISSSIGDLSGDGQADIVVSASTLAKFVVITQVGGVSALGGGTGYTSFDVTVGQSPGISTIADVDGDTLPDLVASLGFASSLMVGPQLVGGGVGELRHYDVTGVPTRTLVGDFNQDGRADVFAASSFGERITQLTGRSGGSLRGARNYGVNLPTASWLAGGDFDGDGDQDLMVGSQDSFRLSLLSPRADGALEVEYDLDLGRSIFQIEAVDLDADGRLDVVCSVAGGLKVLRNVSTPGAYAFEVLPGSPLQTISTATGPFGVAAADLDGDGDLELAACDFITGTVHIVSGTPTAFVFGSEVTLPCGGAPIDIAAADFTGDGRLDLAVSRSGFADVLILRNDAGLNFANHLAVPVGTDPNYLLTADFNADQRADLVVSNATSGTVSVLFGGPSGFTGASYPAGAIPTALLAGDLTGDGKPDILVTAMGGAEFRVLAGDGKGGFPVITAFPGTFGASDALLSDMDGDGRADVVVASLVTDRVSVIRRVGD
ncbi:MAG: hypothetical protein RL398_1324 [Planctomycetota bacterium]